MIVVTVVTEVTILTVMTVVIVVTVVTVVMVITKKKLFFFSQLSLQFIFTKKYSKKNQTKIVMKLNNSNCDETQKLKL